VKIEIEIPDESIRERLTQLKNTLKGMQAVKKVMEEKGLEIPFDSINIIIQVIDQIEKNV
jgi:hypothetical protein